MSKTFEESKHARRAPEKGESVQLTYAGYDIAKSEVKVIRVGWNVIIVKRKRELIRLPMRAQHSAKYIYGWRHLSEPKKHAMSARSKIWAECMIDESIT